jgi:crotonobetainyl-CoA:carnitine CoA-transferase CaiB-like acyl-CoA transferase
MGAELAREIVAASDVVATSFRPGVMDSLGLGYDQLSDARPELIYLACSMAGLTGPISRYGGYAPLFAAYSGLGHLMGYPDGPPSQVRTGADITAGVDGAFAILAALLARDLHGGGTLIDLSAIESQTCLVGEAVLDHLLSGREQHRRGNQEEHFAPHDCYPCAEAGTWISIVVATDAQWRSFAQAIEEPSWAADSRFATASGRVAHRDELDKLVGTWTSRRSAQEAMSVLQAQGVAAVPSYDSKSLFEDPHVIDRQVVSTLDLEGGTTMPLIRLGGRIGGVPQTTDRPGPELGEHNRYVLAELLGHADQQIDTWKREGVIA